MAQAIIVGLGFLVVEVKQLFCQFAIQGVFVSKIKLYSCKNGLFFENVIALTSNDIRILHRLPIARHRGTTPRKVKKFTGSINAILSTSTTRVFIYRFSLTNITLSFISAFPRLKDIVNRRKEGSAVR